MSSAPRYKLFDGRDRGYFLTSNVQEGHTGRILLIPRTSSSISPPTPQLLDAKTVEREMQNARSIPSWGILGTVQLLSGPYLVSIRDATRVGRLLGHDVFRIVECALLPLADTAVMQSMSSAQKNEEEQYIRMIRETVESNSFYFSFGYHLYRRVSAQSQGASDRDASPFHDDHFHWTRSMAMHLASDADVFKSWLIAPIRGFVELKTIDLGKHSIQLALISRQSRFRTGTRFNVRGIDVDGHVANFVETEQILQFGDQVSSFVQVRGSIPLYWEQLPNIRYKPSPKLKLVDPSLSRMSFLRHFEPLALEYGPIQCIDLVDGKGSEFDLARAYREGVNAWAIQGLQYTHFDFHHVCRKMRYDRISILVDQVRKSLDANGYTRMQWSNGTILRQQNGVFRINCIDCLDRTNVVESVFARILLERQLADLNLTAPDFTLSEQPHLEYAFKNMWADNADAVSFIYSGTGALKTDYTRTGRRSFKGMLQDGINSAKRYYLNNFRDGYRQDAISLAAGDVVIRSDEHPETRMPVKRSPIVPLLLLVLGIGFGMIALNLLLGPFLRISLGMNVGVTTLWAVVTSLILVYVISNGRDFVDNPRLVSPPSRSVRV